VIAAGTPPEEILSTLGITEPDDIDIEAIAWECGATILYEPLTGCEANIIGSGDKAIITVNSKTIPARKRFSSGHELGHWMRDRGQSAFGCSKNQLYSSWTGNNPETRANCFASDLLLPIIMFVPLAKDRPITLETVAYLAGVFRMSRTATAMRLVNHGSFPCMLIHYEGGRRKWFITSGSEIHGSLFPADRPQPHSLAAGLIANTFENDKSGDVRADHWFDRDRSEKYYLRESSFKTGSDSVTALLWWEDEQQLFDVEEEEERRASRRSDYREEY
jgi:IrrE N-terminal-like domain